MSLVTLETLVRDHQGHLFDYAEEGFLVLDKTSKWLTHIPKAIPDDSLEQLRAFFQTVNPNEKPMPPSVVSLDADPVEILKNGQVEGVLDAVRFLLKDRKVVLRFYIRNAIRSFREMMTPFESLILEKRLTTHIHCPFTKLNDNEKEFLSDKQCHLFYTGDEFFENEKSQEALFDLAEFGFRIPIVWHVDSENIHHIPSWIDSAMQANFDSGFALPLVSEAFFQHDKTNPELRDYWTLLFDCYRKYPHYDEVFYPFNVAIHDVFETPAIRFLWNGCLTDFQRDGLATRTIRIIARAFLWQRWILQKELASKATE